MSKNPTRVSQSLMKALSDYLQGLECGISFKARYITKEVDFEPSDAMKLGIYFEYEATGCLPRSGEIPEPEYVYKGKPNQRLATDYERAKASAEYFKALIKYFDIKILEKGFVMQTDTMSGIADLIVEWNGKKAIIDLKYTGLIDDKWQDYGWHKDFLSQKDNIMIQGVMYKMLAKEIYGEDLDFYFWVFDSKNPLNVRIIKEVVDEGRFPQHTDAVNNTLAYLEKHITLDDWTPRPELLRCAKCPLKDTCEHMVNHPLIEEIYY